MFIYRILRLSNRQKVEPNTHTHSRTVIFIYLFSCSLLFSLFLTHFHSCSPTLTPTVMRPSPLILSITTLALTVHSLLAKVYYALCVFAASWAIFWSLLRFLIAFSSLFVLLNKIVLKRAKKRISRLFSAYLSLCVCVCCVSVYVCKHEARKLATQRRILWEIERKKNSFHSLVWQYREWIQRNENEKGKTREESEKEWERMKKSSNKFCKWKQNRAKQSQPLREKYFDEEKKHTRNEMRWEGRTNANANANANANETRRRTQRTEWC